MLVPEDDLNTACRHQSRHFAFVLFNDKATTVAVIAYPESHQDLTNLNPTDQTRFTCESSFCNQALLGPAAWRSQLHASQTHRSLFADGPLP